MAFTSEKEFEEALVEELTKYGWSDDVLMNPSEADLVKNWANILFNNNRGRDRLNDQPLTDTEMEQIISQIEELRTPMALNGFINGKTISIKRDNPNDPEHLGHDISLSIYDRLEIAGGKSRYQIARQPKFERRERILPNRRGDVLLLINGMPVIHIELKNSNVSVSQAANQIAKYSHEGIFSRIFSLVQIFVAMKPEETIYFANPGPEGKFDKNYYFHWADFNNEPINDWKKVVSNLLSIPMAHTMIGFYTIADKGDGLLKVLRSYQYYAASAISNKVASNDWSAREQKGGYVWHTTGSGKTMTSFKSAQLIAESGDADKVVFLVDRIELGTQSLTKYRGFAEVNMDIQDTNDTSVLISKLRSDSQSDTLIVTSIQKMSRVTEGRIGDQGNTLQKIQRKHIVFIVDECHRSTFGDMLLNIKHTFKNALFFGFTGTPIKDVNQINMNTTQTVFGDSLHQYLLADGIRDNNVLGFHPCQVTTYKDRDLRQAVALNKAKAKSTKEAFSNKKKKATYLKYMDTSKVPMAGYMAKNGKYVKGIEDEITKSQYSCEKHHKKVVKNIKESWKDLSHCGKFHAILATANIAEAIEYYKLIREVMPKLHVTALFDPTIDNVEGIEYKEDGLKEIIKDYNTMFGTQYTLPQHASFKADLSKRLAHEEPFKGIEGDASKQLNLLIVVNQMLTGYDSKWVNTLYIDKLMEYENIIQSFSRTNRLFGPDKPFGVIRYYRWPHTMKRNIEKAVELYSEGKPVKLFVDPLLHNLERMNEIFRDIELLFKNLGINGFEKLPDNEVERGKFAKLFHQFNSHLEAAKIQSFRWEKQIYRLKGEDEKYHVIEIKINLHTYNILLQRYKELSKGGGGGGHEDVPYDIDPYITEISTDIIDDKFINSRFEKYMRALESGDASEEERNSVKEELHRSFASLSQEEQKYANLFLHDIELGNVSLERGKGLRDYIGEYQVRAKNDEIHRISEAFGLSEEQLRDMVNSNVTEQNINEYNRYETLRKTVVFEKAKAFLEEEEGRPLSTIEVNRELDDYLRNFILNN